MIKLSTDDIILELNKEVKLLDKEIEDLISNSEFNSNKEFVSDDDYYAYSRLMGKRFYLEGCLTDLETHFTPEGDFYRIDSKDYEDGFSYYLAGEYEALAKYKSLLSQLGDVPCNTSHENSYKK